MPTIAVRPVASLVVACLSIGCGAARQPPVDIADELPPWKTQGEQVRLELATKLLDMNNTQAALEILRAMRQEGFSMPEIDLLQGRALRMEGLFDEAEQLLVSSNKRMRGDPRPAAELCILYADAHALRSANDRSDLLNQAVEQCERVVSIDETAADGWNNLGFLYLAVGRVDDALEATGKAVELDGTNALFRNNLALAQASAGRDEAAFRTFQSTLPRANAAYNVGVALERVSNLDGALQYYERAIAFDPKLAEAVAARDRLKASDPLPAGDTP
jgi:tetratricopeptide (TPR) repeat protein